jgi:bifunctional non-homologous end joining protein LigD
MATLKEYRRKRKFAKTPEPAGKRVPGQGDRFVVQKHAARRLHYDLRLEIDGVLKSWAVPKGPSLDPADKRLAVQTEDHPLDYAGFEGVIPEGNYGAGTVMVWDSGTFLPEGGIPPPQQLERGELKFVLRGRKLRGGFVLVKLRRSAKGNEWLLIKHKDAASEAGWEIEKHDGSALSGRTLDEIAHDLPASHPVLEAEPAKLDGARKAKMPARMAPMLATLAEEPFSHPEWLFEVKLDGVRALAWVQGGKVELRSRTGRLITAQYPDLVALPDRLRARQAILDGEIVVLDERGRSDFERLQTRMNVSRPSPTLVRQTPVIYYLFDLLYCEGYDLRDVPLLERKNLLRRLLDAGDPFRYCDHQIEKGKELFNLASEHGLEGIIGKDVRSPYVNRRSPYWMKFKGVQELDAVVGGWTEPRGSREHFGALLVGLYAEKSLRFIGGVGTGFDQRLEKLVYEQVAKLEVRRSPFQPVPKTKEKAHWIKSELVARIKYSNWTEDRHLRAPVFLSLLGDRNPEECQFEAQVPSPVELAPDPRNGQPPRSAALRGHVLSKSGEIEEELLHGQADAVAVEIDGKRLQLTNLNKLYFPESGYTKRHLLAYYDAMAEYILPFLRHRPLVLRRYPDGITGKSFFQKDAGGAAPEWMETVKIYSEENRGEVEYFMANDRASLLYLTNLGCIDHNPWSSCRDDLEHPDYVFFDLDPSQGTEYATVVTVARVIFEKLRKLELDAFLKTSGATGFHLYVPLERGYSYEQARTFSEIVGRLVSAEVPELVTHQRTIRKRPSGTVLIDSSQNALGRPLAAPYAVRAFPKAPVSAPVTPGEMRPSLRPERLNLKSMRARLEKHGDLWADFWKKRQRLEKAIEAMSDQL